ncbi:MAG: RNA polymerase sigma factor [Pirellulaceae bacterium]
MPDEYDEGNCGSDAHDVKPVGWRRENSAAKAAKSDLADFEAWVAEMQPGLLRLGWSVLRDWSLASDAVQEALSLLGQKWEEIEPEHRTGWIVRTVQLQAMALRRKRGRLAKGQVEWSAVPETRLGEPAGAEDELVTKERVERLQQEINKLPVAQKLVVQLRLREERSFADIATELGLPIGTVLSRMRLATKKLRDALREVDSSND